MKEAWEEFARREQERKRGEQAKKWADEMIAKRKAAKDQKRS